MAIQVSDQTKVSIVSAVCLLALVVALKNILHVSAEILSRDVVLYIIIYSTWGIIYPGRVEGSRKSNWYNPLYWSVLIVLVTLAIMVVYAL